MAPYLFSLGRVVSTPGALDALSKAVTHFGILLNRHMTGDWGELSVADRRANDRAVKDGERVSSAYVLSTGVKVWIITEWDRSASTLLLPFEC